MNEWLSNKFKWLSFVATWAVVCIHSRNGQWVSNVEDWATRLQDFIMPAFNFAVPLFFAISGFFFVSSYDKCVTGGALLSAEDSLALCSCRTLALDQSSFSFAHTVGYKPFSSFFF